MSNPKEKKKNLRKPIKTGLPLGYIFKRDINGIVFNKDGSRRKNYKKPYSKLDERLKISAGHRQGSLGEDQESILI
jgi:hypothetical protein